MRPRQEQRQQWNGSDKSVTAQNNIMKRRRKPEKKCDRMRPSPVTRMPRDLKCSLTKAFTLSLHACGLMNTCGKPWIQNVDGRMHRQNVEEELLQNVEIMRRVNCKEKCSHISVVCKDRCENISANCYPSDKTHYSRMRRSSCQRNLSLAEQHACPCWTPSQHNLQLRPVIPITVRHYCKKKEIRKRDMSSDPTDNGDGKKIRSGHGTTCAAQILTNRS